MTSTVRRIAGALAVIGALNWGLVALARFDLVAEIFGMKFGETNAATRVIYGLVGIAGVVLAAALAMPDRDHHRRRRHCPVGSRGERLHAITLVRGTRTTPDGTLPYLVIRKMTLL